MAAVGRTAYVANVASDTVTPITTATNTAGKPIKVGGTGRSPEGIAITPDGKTAYILAMFAGTVTPIATATGTPGTPINAGRVPRAMAITP